MLARTLRGSRLASSRLVACALLGCSAAGASGCSGTPGLPGEGERTGAISVPILNGTTASAYPESALLTMTQTGSQFEGFCSGSLIAPQVVLTAGHCVKGVMSSMQTLIPDTWQITLPYNGNQQFTATSAATYDWLTNDGTVDPTLHDVGLVFLTSAANVTAGQCPALATAPVDPSTQIVNIGRVTGGPANPMPSMTDLFVGAPVSVSDSTMYPFDYQSTDIIEEGDSGGPDEVPGSSPHLIVAVNSGAGTGGGVSEQVLARLDLLNSSANDWIQQQITMHGGLGVCASTTSGASSSGSSGSSGSGSSSGSSSGSVSSNGGGSSGSSSGGAGSSGSGSGSGGSSGSAGTSGSTSSGGSSEMPDGWSTTPQQSAGCACRASGSSTGLGGAPLACLAGLAIAGARRRTRRNGARSGA